MRFTLVPLMFAVILAVSSVTVHANTNQASAEKIAASLGDRFPGYDIYVSYQNGKVQLVGQVASLDMMHSALEHVQRVPGVAVTEIDNGLRINSGTKQQIRQQPVKQELAVTPTKTEQVQPPKAEKTKRSIFSPQPTPQVANAPVPMPKAEKTLVVQASNREQIVAPAQIGHPQQQAMPLEYAHPQMMGRIQGQPMLAPQQGEFIVNGVPGQGMPMQPMPGMPMQGIPQQPQGAYHPEAYGPQGPMPGQYNHPNLPDHAWPSYAAYPNYAEVCYPKQYSPKAWPYIGPFYPYPQAPLGWRKVALEWHDGWWWLDFDDGSPTGPFSPLFRQPVRYTY